MNAENGVDGGDEERVEEGPVRRGGVGWGEGIPGAFKSETFAFDQTRAEGVIGALIGVHLYMVIRLGISSVPKEED